MKLIVQPDDGLTPLLTAIRKAKKTVSLVVFRFDRAELEKALGAAVARGVLVRALIAHTNSGGEKRLRKLEQRLLEAGVTVTRTADDLPRYHGKMTIVDDTVFILGFNYTKQDIEKSRSFGLISRDHTLFKESLALFDADAMRQQYSPVSKRLVVSPENSRDLLSKFIAAAKRRLLIYDERITDKLMLRALRERIAAGVEVRVVGKVDKNLQEVAARRLTDLRLHIRAIIRDDKSAFLGSQSLRTLELDRRREIGVIVNDSRIAKRMAVVFESDWALTTARSQKAEKLAEKAAAKAIEKANGKKKTA